MARVYRHRHPFSGPGRADRARPLPGPRAPSVPAVRPLPLASIVTRPLSTPGSAHRSPSHAGTWSTWPVPGARSRPGLVAVAVALIATVATLTSACTSSASTPDAHLGHAPSSLSARLVSSDRSLARTASSTYRTTVDHDATAFAAALEQLQGDVGPDDIAAARTDELSAQAAYDGIRAELEAADPVIASTLDENPSAVAPGQALAGLHAVESDLWSSPPDDASADMTGLVAQAPVAAYLLARDVLAPEAIGTTAVDELGWVDDVAIPGHEETFSHLDSVDVAAAIGAAQAAYAAIQALAERIAPTLAGSVGRSFATLAAEVAALGPPDLRPDDTVPVSTLRSLSQSVNATASLLAELSARLVPFGTSGTSS